MPLAVKIGGELFMEGHPFRDLVCVASFQRVFVSEIFFERHINGCFWFPFKGGIGSIFHPPEGKDYKWYISGIFPANWGMDYAGNHFNNH